MNNADDKPKVGREWIAFVIAWLPYSLLTYRFWRNVDDAFISFRYAKNWAMGYGLRFNLGPQQPEEGYSNCLPEGAVLCTFIELPGTRHHFLGTDAAVSGFPETTFRPNPCMALCSPSVRLFARSNATALMRLQRYGGSLPVSPHSFLHHAGTSR